MILRIALIILLGVYSVKDSLAIVSGMTLFMSPYLWLPFQIVFAFIFGVKSINVIRQCKSEHLYFLLAYFVLVIFSSFRGVLMAETYWDYKILYENFFGLMMPFFVLGYANLNEFKRFLIGFLPFAFILFIPLSFFIFSDNYGFFLAPVSIYIIFFTSLNLKKKLMVIFVTAFLVFIDLTARSNVLKVLVPFFILLIHLMKKKSLIILVRFLHIFLLVIPFILTYVALTFEINIFDSKNNFDFSFESGANKKHESEDLLIDTRSFMFIESYLSANEYESWFFGRTPMHGQISPSYADFDLNNRNERVTNESAIINVFNWLGLLGVSLYFLIFLTSSYLAIYKSNNIQMKLLGCFISFRWLYSWVEDINSFSLSFFSLCMILILPLSFVLREMSDTQIKSFFK